MQFPNIVALIDARIALLEQVRDLLATPPAMIPISPPSDRGIKHQPPAVLTSKRQIAEALALPSASPENGPMPVASHEPVRLPPVAPRPRSSARKRPLLAETHSALVGQLPSGPVVVPPARVRAEEAQRRIVEGSGLPTREETSVEPDQILRRWLREQHVDTA